MGERLDALWWYRRGYLVSFWCVLFNHHYGRYERNYRGEMWLYCWRKGCSKGRPVKSGAPRV